MKRKRMHSQKIIITGMVNTEPIISFDPQGVPICDFEMVVDRARPGGKPRDRTFFHVGVGGKRASECYAWLRMGDELTVTGSVRVSAKLNPDGKPTACMNVYTTGIEYSEETLARGS